MYGLSTLAQACQKQTLHYTDVSPVVTIAAVTKYGNHPFNYLVEDKSDEITFKSEAFIESVRAYRDQFLSPVYVGWRPGYAPAQFAKLTQLPEDVNASLYGGTPGEIFQALSESLAAAPHWLD